MRRFAPDQAAEQRRNRVLNRPEYALCNALNKICPELVKEINDGVLLTPKQLPDFPVYTCDIQPYTEAIS